jgi:hypothetical protein
MNNRFLYLKKKILAKPCRSTVYERHEKSCNITETVLAKMTSEETI